MSTLLTAKRAQAIKIFYLAHSKVQESTLYDFVMKSKEELPTPRGVTADWHIRHREEDQQPWQVWKWGPTGQYPRLVKTFSSEQEAEDHIFRHVYECDFAKDDQRSTDFYYTREKAEAALKELL